MYEERRDLVGKPVESLQTMIREIAYIDNDIAPLITDGIYGNQTATSVKQIQRSGGLQQTGVADLQTWEHLTARYLNAVNRLYPESLTTRLLPGEKVEYEEARDIMFIVQGMFLALEIDFSDTPKVQATGVNDSATQDALRWMQDRSDLEAHGKLDIPTWNALVRAYMLSAKATNRGLQLTKNDGTDTR